MVMKRLRWIDQSMNPSAQASLPFGLEDSVTDPDGSGFWSTIGAYLEWNLLEHFCEF